MVGVQRFLHFDTGDDRLHPELLSWIALGHESTFFSKVKEEHCFS